jgi:pyruvate/2-oxoglutarate dehydrogenase complex dihydrolipoamide acyltransferase (E2) component
MRTRERRDLRERGTDLIRRERCRPVAFRSGQATEQAGGQQGGGGQGEPRATNAARRKTEELGVDLSQIEGTGAQGQITIDDVNNAANQ